MDAPPKDILVILIAFALPLEDAPKSESTSSGTHFDPHNYWQRRKVKLQENAALIKARTSEVRRSLSWVASLRNTNRQWRALLDDDEGSIWLQVALALGLDPPRQLYYGANHMDVCKSLLKAEDEKAAAGLQAVWDFEERLHNDCFWEGGECYGDHAHPERPFVLERLAAQTKALGMLLTWPGKSTSLTSRLAKGGRRELWAKSALNRYRMFLHMRRANPSVWFVPTADIEFCWLAHIFRTEDYWKDMTALGIDPGHSLCLNSYGEAATHSNAVEATAAAWKAEFGEKLPFLPRRGRRQEQIWKGGYADNFKVKRSFSPRFCRSMGPEILNLPSKVALPNISITAEDIDADIDLFRHLGEASSKLWDYAPYERYGSVMTNQVVPSYERFLNLCNRERVQNPAAPPGPLGLVWHAHRADPVRYRDDCLEHFGAEFRHHPWPNGRGIASDTPREFERAWKASYGIDMGEDWKYRTTGGDGDAAASTLKRKRGGGGI